MLLTEREQNQTNAFLATLGRTPNSTMTGTQNHNYDSEREGERDTTWRRPPSVDPVLPPRPSSSSSSSSSLQDHHHHHHHHQGVSEDEVTTTPLNKSHLQNPPKQTQPRTPTPPPHGNPAPYPQSIFKTHTPTPTPTLTPTPTPPPSAHYYPKSNTTTRDYSKPPTPLYSNQPQSHNIYPNQTKQPSYHSFSQVTVLHDEIERLQQRIMDRLHSPYPT